MSQTTPTHGEGPGQSQQRQKVLSRWDKEGGACRVLPAQDPSSSETEDAPHEMTNTELVHLRVRVIALENLVISLLAGATERQVDLAREMVGYITPRPGFTEHPLTIQAASHMESIVERSGQFRTTLPAPQPYKRTAIFDEVTLPAGLRKEHRTKPGVWGIIRVLHGRLLYKVLEQPLSEEIVQPGRPGLILPDQPHLVEPLEPMQMQIEFYDQHPHT